MGGSSNQCISCAAGLNFIPSNTGGSCSSGCPAKSYQQFGSFINNLYSFASYQQQSSTSSTSSGSTSFLSDNTVANSFISNVPSFNYNANSTNASLTNSPTFYQDDGSVNYNNFMWQTVDFYWNLFGLNLTLIPASPKQGQSMLNSIFNTSSIFGGISGGTYQPSWSQNNFTNLVTLMDSRDPTNIRQYQYDILSNIYTILYSNIGNLDSTCLPCFYNCSKCAPGFFLISNNGTCVLECPLGTTILVQDPTNQSTITNIADSSLYGVSQGIQSNSILASNWTSMFIPAFHQLNYLFYK